MTEKYLTFCLNNMHYGISTSVVEEIDHNVEINKVLLTYKFVVGIDNFRGSIVALFDINTLLFEMEPTNEYSGRIIIKEKEFSKALLIDKVLKIVEINDIDIKGQNSGLLLGFVEIDGNKVYLIDDFELLKI